MKTYTDLEFLKLSRWRRFWLKVGYFFAGIPRWFLNLFITIGNFFKNAAIAVKDEFVDIWMTFKKGDWKTRLSFVLMGFSSIARGQILRGILFFAFEIIFVVYMILAGWKWMVQLPLDPTVLKGSEEVYDEVLETYTTIYHDDTFKIVLYGVLTIFFIIAFIYTWRVNVKQAKLSQEMVEAGHKLRSGKDDLRSLVDDQFYKTLLALPLTGILIFTVMPIVFMILIAFTNYSGPKDGYVNLFQWVGFDNFNTLLGWTSVSGGVNYSATFGEILLWTLIWAFFATFTNYFLGMFGNDDQQEGH